MVKKKIHKKNILVIGKLPANSLECAIQPIEMLHYVNKILLLRNNEYFSDIGKIININNLSIKRTVFRLLSKLIIGIFYTIEYKPKFIISIHIYPHGYIGKIISILTFTPHILSIIAGKREFYVYGRFLERINFAIFKTSKFITITGSETYNYLKNKGISKEKLIIIPNVINMRKFFQVNIDKKYDVLALGRIDKNKNLIILIKALLMLKKDNIKYKAAIAGNGPERNHLIEIRNEFNLDKSIDFLNWIPREKINWILSISKIFVLPSKGEGLPLALLESMASGLVPIVSNVGDNNNIVHNGENGFLLNDPDNASDLAEKIKILIENPHLFKKMSQKAQNIKNTHDFSNAKIIWNRILSDYC